MAHNPERLMVVQKADAFVVDVHCYVRATQRELADASPGLRNQLLRAAVSISNNIGESCGHHSPRRAASFIDVAIGSCNEVERMLNLLRRLSLLHAHDERLIAEVQQVRALAYGFRRKILGISSPAPAPAQAEAPTSDI